MESDGLIVARRSSPARSPACSGCSATRSRAPADVAFTSELLRPARRGCLRSRSIRDRRAGAAPARRRVHRGRRLAAVAVEDARAAAHAHPHLLDADRRRRPGRVRRRRQPGVDRARARGAGAGAPSSARNVGAQLGRAFDEAEYLRRPGLCPLCHLDVDRAARARPPSARRAAPSGCSRGRRRRRVRAHARRSPSIDLSMTEKLDHFAEIHETAAQHAPMRDLIERSAREYAAWDPRIIPPRRVIAESLPWRASSGERRRLRSSAAAARCRRPSRAGASAAARAATRGRAATRRPRC